MGQDPDSQADRDGTDIMAVLEASRAIAEDPGTVESNVRLMIANIERNLRNPTDGVASLEIPFIKSEDEFYLFCILLSENDWLKKNAMIMLFPDAKGTMSIGLILRSNQEFWTSPQALIYLSCNMINISFYPIEDYVRSAVDQMRIEREISD